MFDFGVYLKARVKHGSNYGNFIISKSDGMKNGPAYNLFLLGVSSIIAILYIITHFVFFSLFGFLFVYIYLVLISFIVGLSVNSENIKSIGSPSVNIGKFKFDMGPPGGLEGTIIDWKKRNYATKFYSILRFFVKMGLYLLGILIILAVLVFVIGSFINFSLLIFASLNE
jgi:hypothetical protein